MIETGIISHRSTVRMALQSRRRSNLGSVGKPMCSSTWHKSLGNKKGIDSARGRLLRWTLSSKWNKDVIISPVGLNQKPSKMRYRASKMAPLLWTKCWSRKKVRPQNMVYKKHARWELPLEQNGPSGHVPGEKMDHLPSRGMGPLSIIC